MIADSSRESTSTDPVAHDMDPLAQPGLDSKEWHEHMHGGVSVKNKHEVHKAIIFEWVLYFVVTLNLEVIQL